MVHAAYTGLFGSFSALNFLGLRKVKKRAFSRASDQASDPKAGSLLSLLSLLFLRLLSVTLSCSLPLPSFSLWPSSTHLPPPGRFTGSQDLGGFWTWPWRNLARWRTSLPGTGPTHSWLLCVHPDYPWKQPSPAPTTQAAVWEQVAARFDRVLYNLLPLMGNRKEKMRHAATHSEGHRPNPQLGVTKSWQAWAVETFPRRL